MSPTASSFIHFDRTGFPYVELASGLGASLFPLARAQVEHFLGDTPEEGEALAERLLDPGPRESWRVPSASTLERQFATSLGPEEVERVARWMGPSYRLPTVQEWRNLDRELGAISDADLQAILADDRAYPAVRSIGEWLLRNRSGPVGMRVGLLREGLLEWVAMPEGGHGLFGRPRPSVYRLIQNPQIHEPLRPRTGARHPSFGARLVRSA